MARKNTLVTELAVNQSLSANFNSPVTVTRNLDNLSYQINVTTTDSQGTFALQGSDDYAINESTNAVENSGTWITVPLGSIGGGNPTVAAANDQILISINQWSFQAMRLTYVSSVAGTGHCNIYLTGKQLSG